MIPWRYVCAPLVHRGIHVHHLVHREDSSVVAQSELSVDLPQSNIMSTASRAFLADEGTGRPLYIIDTRAAEAKNPLAVAYETGVALGTVAREALRIVLHHWSRHLFLYILSTSLSEKIYTHNVLFQRAYDWAGAWLYSTLRQEVYEQYRKSLQAGLIPRTFHEEMKGTVRGYNDNVTLDLSQERMKLADLVFLNYGMDVAFQYIYQGRLGELLQRMLAKAPLLLLPILQRWFPVDFKDWKVPELCTAHGVWGRATAAKPKNQGSFFMRNYQLHNGRYWNELHAFMVRIRAPGDLVVFVGVPGMLGGLTSYTSTGVCMALNTVRSVRGTQQMFSQSALTVLRSCWDQSLNTLSEIQTFLGKQHWSTAWLLSVQTLREGGIGFEVVPKGQASPASSSSSSVPQFTCPAAVVERLQQHMSSSRPYRTWDPRARLHQSAAAEVYRTEWRADPVLHDMNRELVHTFCTEAQTYWSQSFWQTPQPLFGTSWEMERVLTQRYLGNHFLPLLDKPLPPNTFLVCNTFTHPQARLTSMYDTCNRSFLISSSEYRTAKLAHLLQAHHGHWDLERCQETVAVFNYGVETGHYPQASNVARLTNHRWAEGHELSGMLNVIDLKRQRFYLKSGYVGSPWLSLALSDLWTIVSVAPDAK
jgi:hypothetical protein